jgi:7,8-dihydropterin-6-yl-methyl-4-(beta-D-ribofuranosyl)aminobenzene 5'-phosphate synthase
MTQQVVLRPIDAAEVTIVVDNSIDLLLPSTEVARRPAPRWDLFERRDQLRAEHGLSLLLTVHADGRSETLLYDAGLGPDTAVHNMDVLGIRPTDFRAMVLSHGHIDHHGGLEGLFACVGRRSMPLVLHPDAWRERKIVFPSGNEVHMPPPSHQDLDREGWEVVEERRPSYLLEGMVLVTGQVERVTDFEKGFPFQQARADGGWEPDPWVWEDQAVVVHVKDRGLVVLTGCSHAGVVNVLRHAQRITGVDRVHAVVGGLHLTGGLFEPIIPDTLAALTAMQPDVIAAGHCTGWKAMQRIATQLPHAYVPSSVGTQLHFGVRWG